MDRRAVKRLGLVVVAAMFGAAVITGGLTMVAAPRNVWALGAGATLELQVTGVAGVPVDAAAVVLNMTAVNAQAPGFATVYPCGQSRPEASNLNYAAGQTIPNLVIAKPGAGGKVCIYSYATIDVLADVSGFFPAGSAFTPISNPTRVLDTRTPPPPATPPPPTTPPPPATGTLFPGTTLIGAGAPAGRYIAQALSGCYWERLSGLGGTLNEIIANDFQSFAGPAIVDIRPTDLAFKFDADCRTFKPYTPPASASATITQGAWVVGSDIQPGTYSANVSNGCYWERATSFDGGLGSIIANDFISTGGTAFVTIAFTDTAFKTDNDCGTWTRIA